MPYKLDERILQMRSIERHYGTEGGRFLCPQTVCRRSLWLTSPSPQCNYRLFVLGTRGHSWQKIRHYNHHQRREKQDISQHIFTSIALYLLISSKNMCKCFSKFHKQCKWQLSLTYRSDSPYKKLCLISCPSTHGYWSRDFNHQTKHYSQSIYILPTIHRELFCHFILGSLSYFEVRKSVLRGNKGNCLVFVTIQVAWKHICYCQTVYVCILKCFSGSVTAFRR